MFIMVRDYIKQRTVFEALCKTRENSASMQHYLFLDEERDKLQGLTSFLSTAFQFTRVSRGCSYVSLSFLPMVYDARKSRCGFH